MFKKSIFLTLFLPVMIACTSSQASPAVLQEPTSIMATATEDLVATATHTLIPSLTPSPLPTLTPTATVEPSPTMTFTPTPVPSVLLTTFSSYTAVMYGPGTEYDTLAILSSGLQFEVVGQNRNWLLVDLGFNQNGWISLEAADVEGQLDGITVVEAPPTPTPTVTPEPQPVIISLGADSDSVRVAIEGFNPSEFITIQIIEVSTGNVIHVQTLNVYPKGNHPGIRIDPKDELDGNYILLIIGESGRSVQRSFSVTP